jgi:hypothetical protein
MVSILKCLLQTQIYSRNTHTQAKKSMENTKLWGKSELLKNLRLDYILLELVYHRWASSFSGGFAIYVTETKYKNTNICSFSIFS